MDTSAVPQDDISWTRLDLLPLASSVVEPLQLAFGVVVRIDPFPSAFRRFILVRLEKLGVERERSFQHHQTAVVGSILVL